ncbi:ADP-ribosylation factor [Helicosporidium sp. ATCC 50920]|nr:ADP-ribosylation factor [Helicosporidium sp. ATCC 50920]|eukprot:KDD75710.1 ADP-ribosylation factor [Helicosporidium sp. ATCC 50920]
MGLDNAGKTTTLFQLHLGETVSTAPTLGSNVETIKCEGLNFEMWDLGGQSSLRPSWDLYLTGADAFILVVDACDRARLPLVRAELERLLAHERLLGAPMLVLANKQDLEGSLSAAALGEALGLVHATHRSWHIQPACATRGEGLLEGLQWLAKRVQSRDGAPAKH